MLPGKYPIGYGLFSYMGGMSTWGTEPVDTASAYVMFVVSAVGVVLLFGPEAST